MTRPSPDDAGGERAACAGSATRPVPRRVFGHGKTVTLVEWRLTVTVSHSSFGTFMSSATDETRRE